MEKCTIYYDDTSESSKRYAETFRGYPNIECKRASAFRGHQMIYEPNHAVGFVFHSSNGRLSPDMRHIIWRIIMEKDSHIFLLVADGNREMRAIKSAADSLTPRGYRINNVYTKYIFEKYHVTNHAEKVVEDIAKDSSRFTEHVEEIRQMSKRDLRNLVRANMKKYYKYKKEQKKQP